MSSPDTNVELENQVALSANGLLGYVVVVRKMECVTLELSVTNGGREGETLIGSPQPLYEAKAQRFLRRGRSGYG